MATLPTADTDRIWRGLMRWWSAVHETTPFLKEQLRAAVVATDQWIDNNQTSYNNSLPAQFRNSATTPQKTLLFCAVALMRAGINLLKAVFGEVD